MKSLAQFLAAVQRERTADGSVYLLRWRIAEASIEMGRGTVGKRRRLAVRIAAWAAKIWESKEKIP